jgi:YidC/Oxa1 family membrane protein insertase
VANIWTMWLDLLGTVLNFLASEVGLGLGLAIVVMTLVLRTLLLPVSWSAAYGGCLRQKKMKQLQPELAALKEKFAAKPELYSRELLKLYKAHDLAMVDGRNLVGALAQLPVFIAMFRVLRGAGKGARFLWVPDLLKPNVVLAILVGLSAVLMIAVNPDMPEQTRMLMMAISAVIAVASALHFGSALALYWTTSNLFSTLQTLALHGLINRRIRLGTLKI